MRFADKRVLVNGAEMSMGDVNEDRLQETAALIEGAAVFLTYDAGVIASCKALVVGASANGLGGLCNIAGILDRGETLDFHEIRFEQGSVQTRQLPAQHPFAP